MKTLGEPLDEAELLQFSTLCGEHEDPTKFGMLSCKKLAEVMLPEIAVETEMTKGTKH